MNTQNCAVIFENVSVSAGTVSILEGITAHVPLGKNTAIVGPNGAGKTTLLLALLGECNYTGSISIMPHGNKKNCRIGYVPQKLQFDRGMPVTVLEFLAMGIQNTPLVFGVKNHAKKRAQELLSYVKSENLIHRTIGALSGGELQRILLSLALEQEPELLILDEPAAGVDFHGEHIFCEILETLRNQWKFTQLMISHDLATVTHHSDHVICLNRKIAAEGPPQQVLTHENLAAVFGIHMGLINYGSMPDNHFMHNRSTYGHEYPYCRGEHDC